MREMKDSGIEWIGEIPKDWIITKIKNHFKIGSGTTPTSDDPELWNGDIVWITPADFKTDDVYVEKGHRYLSEKGFTSSSLELIEPGNIIFSKRAPIGQVVINRTRLCTNQGCLTVVKTDKSDVRYYRYVMSVATEEFELSGSGTTFKEISANTFANTFLPRPSCFVQENIADYLDKKCAKIDAIIEKQQEIIEKLKEYKLSIISETVTKGLNPDVEMKDSEVEWIGKIPAHWSLVKAKYYVDITNGSDPKEEGDIPVYGSGEKSFKTCGEYKEGPCVLIGRKGATLNIPHYIVGKYWNVDTAFDVKTKKGMLLKYYFYLANCFDYNKFISQTTLPGMTQTNYNNMLIPVPSIDEQEDIVRYVDEKIKKIDCVLENCLKLLNNNANYKRSLIYEAVTGKREV